MLLFLLKIISIILVRCGEQFVLDLAVCLVAVFRFIADCAWFTFSTCTVYFIRHTCTSTLYNPCLKALGQNLVNRGLQ